MNKTFHTTPPPPCRYLLFIAALMAAGMAAACNHREQPRATSSDSDTVARAADSVTRSPDTARRSPLPSGCPQYAGTIDTIGVEMQLCRKADELHGIYRYKRIGKDIEIQGHVEPDGNFILYEWGKDQKKQTGQFLGLFTADGSMEGDWVAADGKRTLRFALRTLQATPPATSMFNGEWRWEGDEGASFTLSLREARPGALTGYHCSVTSNARRVDCSTQGDEVMDQGATIQGSFDGRNATVTFRSTYGLDDKGNPVTGRARIIRMGDSLIWRIMGTTTGEHWLPYNARLGRDRPEKSN